MITYRMVVIALFVVLLMSDAYAETEPAEITISIRGAHKAVASALLEAVEEEILVTGIADFDSLSSTYGLMRIHRKGRISPFYDGNRFRLTFPPDADVAAIAGAYWNLFYIQSVEPEPPPEVQTRKLTVKERHRPSDIENVDLRILKKVGVGTFSGIAFTLMTMGVLDRIYGPEGNPDADAYRTISFLLFGSIIGSSVGFPLGVSSVDPYDSLPMTLLAGVIPGALGTALIWAGHETGFVITYVTPVITSLIASELSRKPLLARLKSKPQDHSISFGLAPRNGGLSAVAQLRF